MENNAENKTEKKKIIFSGIQPTGCITLGNYIGALKNWVDLQNDYNCLFSVVDLHSITVRQDSALLRKRCIEFLVQYLACGIDAEKNILFFQSHVPQHAELSWVLSCFTYMGELSRMTQYKDKCAKHADNINAGLFTYPVLMAADILLYQTDFVPIGIDQKQHLEITRNIADRFNGLYGNTFKLPEPFIGKSGAKIMSLQEPNKKMSKSDTNPKAFISVLDDDNTIMKKIKSAVTDSEARVYRKDGKDGVNNLMGIYSCCTGKTDEEIEKEFDGKGYGDFKNAVGEAVCDELRPLREEYNRLISDKAYLAECMKEGAEKASYTAERTLKKAMKKVGFLQI